MAASAVVIELLVLGGAVQFLGTNICNLIKLTIKFFPVLFVNKYPGSSELDADVKDP